MIVVRQIDVEKLYGVWMALSLCFLSIFHFCCVLCGKTPRRNCKIHGRNSRQFFLAIFSPVVYSAAKHSGETAQYRDGTLAIFFVAFLGLLCPSRHFVPAANEKMVETSIEKAPLWGLGRSGRGPGRSRRTFHCQLWKKRPQEWFTDTLWHLFWDPILDTFWAMGSLFSWVLKI